MIYINVANNEKNKVLDCLISELANVFLIALGHELIEDNIEKAVNRLSGITIMESEDDVIKINLDNEDIMFCIEDDITGVFFASTFCRKLQNKNVGRCKTVL